MKKINICDKEYTIDCNAYTYVQFKNIFKRGLFSDLQIIKNFLSRQSKIIFELTQEKIGGKDLNKLDKNEKKKVDVEIEKELNIRLLDYIDDFIEAITRIAYILVYEANPDFKTYEEFMKEIPRLSVDDDWVLEVTEFAVEKFC